MRIVIAAAAMAIAGAFTAGPAVAHDDQGLMTGETRPGPDGTSVTMRARVVYANDQHPTDTASVTVTGTGPNGAQAGPASLPSVGEGAYEAVVALPATGDWSFQLNATNPAATATATATLPTPTTAPPTTTLRPAASEAADDDSAGLSPALIAFAGAVVVAGLVAGLIVLRRRR